MNRVRQELVKHQKQGTSACESQFLTHTHRPTPTPSTSLHHRSHPPFPPPAPADLSRQLSLNWRRKALQSKLKERRTQFIIQLFLMVNWTCLACKWDNWSVLGCFWSGSKEGTNKQAISSHITILIFLPDLRAVYCKPFSQTRAK